MTGPLAGKSRIGLDIGGVPKQSKISLICITDKRQRPGGYSVRISTPFVRPPSSTTPWADLRDVPPAPADH